MRVIRKYANRKLYDVIQHHYVTLAMLAALVRTGEEVQIIDHVTGADLTAQSLTQVIFEEATQADVAGPRVTAELLVKIIRVGIAG